LPPARLKQARTEVACQAELGAATAAVPRLLLAAHAGGGGGRGGALLLISDAAAGGDLRAALAVSGALPEAAARTLAVSLCGALVAAHAAGVTHRDVKPENILLPAPGDFQDALLGDWGLAWRGGEEAAAVAGTVAYLPPEAVAPLLRGRAAEAAAAAAAPPADVFALGLVIAEALCGAHPVVGDASRPDALLAAGWAVRDAAARAAAALPAGASAACRDFLARALCAEPGGRATAAQLAAHPWLAATAPPALAVDVIPVAAGGAGGGWRGCLGGCFGSGGEAATSAAPAATARSASGGGEAWRVQSEGAPPLAFSTFED
jgi:serine/threonine-protein kinase